MATLLARRRRADIVGEVVGEDVLVVVRIRGEERKRLQLWNGIVVLSAVLA